MPAIPNNAIGSCRLFSAAISGFSPTSLDTDAAGWTLKTGAHSSAQDATHLAVIDNGFVRITADRNATGSSPAPLNVYAFNGTTWQLALAAGGAGDWNSPTIVQISYNSSQMVRLRMSIVDSASRPGQIELTVIRGIPSVWAQVIYGSAAFNHSLLPASKVVATFGPTSAAVASDIYGASNFDIGANSDMWAFSPLPAAGIGVVAARATTHSTKMAAISSTPAVVVSPDAASANVGDMDMLGFIQRTYGMGDGGGADVGNGDGQLREGEDNFTSVTGTWAKATGVTGASSGSTVRRTSLALNDKVRWTMNFAGAGSWYVGVMAKANAGTPQVDVAVNGVFSGSPKVVPTTGFDVQTTQLMFGPFSPASGDRTVDVKVTTLSSATQLDVDFVAIYPYAWSSGTVPFPKDLAHTMLYMVTPQAP